MSESRIRQSQIISPQQFNVEARTSHTHRNLRYIARLCGERLRESLGTRGRPQRHVFLHHRGHVPHGRRRLPR